MGPNNWGISLILPVTTGEGIGPAGEISPLVCMLKNGLVAGVVKQLTFREQLGQHFSVVLPCVSLDRVILRVLIVEAAI